MKNAAHEHTSTDSKANAEHVGSQASGFGEVVSEFSGYQPIQRQVVQMAVGAGKAVGDKVANVENYEVFEITGVDDTSYDIEPVGDSMIEFASIPFDDPDYIFYQRSGGRNLDGGAMAALLDKFTTAKKRMDYFEEYSDYGIESGVNRFQDPDGSVTYEKSSPAPFIKTHYEAFFRNAIGAIGNEAVSANIQVLSDTQIRYKLGGGWSVVTLWNDRTAVANKDRMLTINAAGGQSYTMLEAKDGSSNSETYVIDTQSQDGKTPSAELSGPFGRIGKATQHKDLLHLMETLAGGGDIEGIDTAELNRLITATPYNQTWLASKFRFQGKHEWVPSNMVYKVIKKAQDDNRNLKWIKLQDKLATNTGDLIFKPAKAKAESEVDAGAPSLQGHSGAIYGKRDGKSNKPLTQGQADFHDELRTKFEQANTPTNAVDRLKTVAQAWIWNNEAANAVHDKHSRGSGDTAATDTATLLAEQPAAYTRVTGKFDEVKDELTD